MPSSPKPRAPCIRTTLRLLATRRPENSGPVTVDPDHHFLVSRRIREEFENGRDYYALHGREIRLPEREIDRPSAEFLRWHNEERFLG